MFKIKLNKIRIVILLVLSMILVGLLWLNNYSKKYGYKGVLDISKTYISNLNLAKESSPLVLNIDISKTDWQFIVEKREIALDRGLQINIGNNYVPCNINTDNETQTAVIRLKGHMTDHLEGNKWSYRIKSSTPILGMNRFSIQHPGTRNYIYEWIYHQLLKNENIIHLYYDFVNVNINGEKLGIYALEEHFGQHVLERNNRPKGAILRWNPNLYWEWRIDEFQTMFLDEEYSSYSSSFIEPYDRATVKKDTTLLGTYIEGAKLLESFRRNNKITSEVFDVEKMAIFHVIIDLVGGYHSLDWSDVKLYYNSETKRIEPVGYESFSIRKTEVIAGQRKPENYDGLSYNYHDQLFGDPVFFEAYIRNMERIVSTDYLNHFFNSIEEELNKKMAIIVSEWPLRKLTFEGYYENVRLIKNNINLPKPIHAFIQDSKDSLLKLSLSPVTDFPIEIIGLEKNGKEFKLDSIISIPAKARRTYTKYFDYILKNPFSNKNNINLILRIPGGSQVFKVELYEYPSYKIEKSRMDTILSFHRPKNLIHLDSNVLAFNEKSVLISNPIIVNKNEKLLIRPGQKIEFQDSGEITIKGKLLMLGSDEEGGNIEIKGDNGKGFILIESNSEIKNTVFSGQTEIKLINSELLFNDNIVIDNPSTFLSSDNSDCHFEKCIFSQVNVCGVFNESIITINESVLQYGSTGIISNGSFINLRTSEINHFENASDLNYSSSLLVWASIFNSNKNAFNIKNDSNIKFIRSSINNCDVAINIGESLLKNNELLSFLNTNFKKVKIKENRIL